MRDHRYRARGAALLTTLLLSGCEQAPKADPATEAPVNPSPGRYEIESSVGGLFGAAQGSEKQKPVCLKAVDAARFGDRLAEKFAKFSPVCSLSAQPRRGNVIAGSVSCAADPKLAQGFNRFVYSGVIAREAVTVEVQIKFDATPIKDGEADDIRVKLAMKAMEEARFVVKAARTGDCE